MLHTHTHLQFNPYSHPSFRVDAKDQCQQFSIWSNVKLRFDLWCWIMARKEFLQNISCHFEHQDLISSSLSLSGHLCLNQWTEPLCGLQYTMLSFNTRISSTTSVHQSTVQSWHYLCYMLRLQTASRISCQAQLKRKTLRINKSTNSLI